MSDGLKELHDSFENMAAIAFRIRDERDELQAKVRELEQALHGVMKLVDDGVLVRETGYDHEPGWGMRGHHLVMVLKQAMAALNAPDKAVKTSTGCVFSANRDGEVDALQAQLQAVTLERDILLERRQP